MAKAGDHVPRGRGRPKIDRAAEIAEVLVKWLAAGNRSRDGIYRAVRSAVPLGVRGYRDRRRALNKALLDMGRLTMLRRAIAATAARNLPIPQEALSELAALEEAEQQTQAEYAEHNKQRAREFQAAVDRANAPVKSMLECLERQKREIEYIERVLAFQQFFADVLPSDLRISVIVTAYRKARQAVLEVVAAETGGENTVGPTNFSAG